MIDLNSYGGLQLLNQKVPRVKSMAEVDRFPTQPNSENVFFDENDETIIYIKVTAQNGFSRSARYRCYEEPEPTAEDKLEEKFLTKAEFNSFHDEFKEFRKEMMANAHSSESTKPNTTGKSNTNH